MGAIKKLHIDCEPGDCQVPQFIETCYMQISETGEGVNPK